MYTDAARLARRCTATTRSGEACKAFAMWDDGAQRCAPHAGRMRGPDGGPHAYTTLHARYTPCDCPAYAWPHRPGGGLCRWPDPPDTCSPIASSTHRWPRFRRR
jgi:hypothetical protein